MTSDPVTFLASFPPIQSAIKVGTDGLRIQLDIPESEMANAVELLAMRNVVLRVTVEIAGKLKEEDERKNGAVSRRAAKQRK